MIRDVMATHLKMGMMVVIRDLKVGSDVIKQGLELEHSLGPISRYHDISARVDKVGSVYLKSSVVRHKGNAVPFRLLTKSESNLLLTKVC